MNTLKNVQPRPGQLCEQCAKVDFHALFRQDMKAFWLGTLSTIIGNATCPFCRLVVEVINDRWRGGVTSDLEGIGINVWIKTTLWAHCSDSREEKLDQGAGLRLQRETYLRFRPAIGTDWTPMEEDRRGLYSAPRFTLCELDRLPSLECLPFPRDTQQDWSQVLRRRRIPEVANIALIRSWIEECRSEHGHIHEKAKSQAQLRAIGQFRVIDVVDSCLIEPTDDVDYIALSYVWGDALRERQAVEPGSWWRDLYEINSRAEWPEQPRRLRFDKLPATIRDACEFVKSINRRYMWVDLLCIRQDDLQEKKILIQQMNLIYEGASFTVVAAGGKSAESRLHGLYNNTRSPEKVWVIPTQDGKLRLTVARPALSKILSSTVWSTRGWTFQEDILSSCCLYFTSNEIFYSCRYHSPQYHLPPIGYYDGFKSGRLSEWREGYVLETKYTKTAYQSTSLWNDGWLRLPISGLRSEARAICPAEELRNDNAPAIFSVADPTASIFMDTNFREYANFVCEYTRRTLTNPDDAVNAFMGILNKFGTKLPLSADVQFHGLLDYGTYNTPLEVALLWTRGLSVPLKRRHIYPTPGQVTPRQPPSWAWSGWDGPVKYFINGSRNDNSWIFWPVAFEPKSAPTQIRKTFMWRSLGNRKVLGRALEANCSLSEIPEENTIALASSCTLTLFTYVLDVKKLTPGFSYVAQEYDTRMNYPIYNIHIMGGVDGVHHVPAVIDSETTSLEFQDMKPGKYKLVYIGKGLDSSSDNVLLVEKKGDYYERVGLTTIQRDYLGANFEWISIV